MGTAVLAVVGTLLGAVIGAAGTYFAQSRQYKVEAAERHGTLLRQLGLDWLAAQQSMYAEIVPLVENYLDGGISEGGVTDALGGVSQVAGQNALDALRLVAADGPVEVAARQWRHLRRHGVPLGHGINQASWRAWQNKYYDLRRSFMNAIRVELGTPALDWRDAGVNDRPSEPNSP